MYDIAIIGAGITGTAIARELSKFKLNIALIEKENDISDGTTKANSAIVHAGYDATEDSLKARFNVKGNALYETLTRELYVPFQRIGSLVLAFSEEEMTTIRQLYDRGQKNGVPELSILTKEETLALEPNVSEEIFGALHAKTAGIVGPWELAIALAENAIDNGVNLFLNHKVTDIEKQDQGYVIKTNESEISSKLVINCAGLYADEVNDMVAPSTFKILPNSGEYNLFDKSMGKHVNSVIFRCPTKKGKGVLVAPTAHGNLIVGPTSTYVEDKDDLATTFDGLSFINDYAKETVKDLDFRNVITSFTGLRAKTQNGDFIVSLSKDIPNFINVAGIDSPGLTAAPAIAEHVVSLVESVLGKLTLNVDFKPNRKPPIHFISLPDQEKDRLIKENPAFGRVICRCENITEGEIIDVINRSAGATTLDGVKRRARPGSGRCQGGFCAPRVMEILSRELKIDIENVVKDSKDSYILTGQTK